MANGTSIRERSLQLAKESNPKAKNMAIDSIVDEFLDGVLVTLAYVDTDSSRGECLVYVVGERYQHFSSSTELARSVGPFQRRSPWNNFVRSVSSAGMPGLLAFIILITICALTLMGKKGDIPDILANALTVILGFYFGRQGARGA